MSLLNYILLSILILRNIFSIYKIGKVLKQHKKEYSLLCSEQVLKEKIPIYIFIPVLHEAQHIEETSLYYKSLLKDNIFLFFISTEKEKEIFGNKETYDKICHLLENSSIKNIWHIHYPRISWVKSDQINYAVQYLSIHNPNFKDAFIAIYDIDSRPNHKTFEVLYKTLERYPYCNVFQQSAIFLNNWQSFTSNPLENLFLKIVAIAQTRFTFAHEIPRIFRKMYNKVSLLERITYAHCVGHGLFIRSSFLSKVPLPENYYPEDMFYWYILSCIWEPIVSLSVFDNSNMPTSFKHLFLQRSKRFLWPFLSIKYLKYLKHHYTTSYKRNLLYTFLVTAYSLFNSLEWIFTSIIFFYLVYLFFLWSSILTVLSLVTFLTYMLSYLLLLRNINLLEKLWWVKITKYSLHEYTLIILFSPIYLLFHSLPAIFRIFQMIFKN